ncbi:MAG: hypothetical protein JOZ90_09375 [Alphaproteobacteria bacterium]|nr:hypothetical protein [Alphaproteobacteria bacterium]MBV9371848.1 hypothetical protein [Alphaproteobacteria bacterium]MBV9901295.1 hypothetical protein [Alphaproteobacteria bacterium]
MDHRQAVAYFVLLLTLSGLAAAWWRATRGRRAARRAALRFERERLERRAERRREGGG